MYTPALASASEKKYNIQYRTTIINCEQAKCVEFYFIYFSLFAKKNNSNNAKVMPSESGHFFNGKRKRKDVYTDGCSAAGSRHWWTVVGWAEGELYSNNALHNQLQ